LKETNAKPNLHKGHRDRMRKEFIANGFAKEMSQHKMLEMLLFYAVPQKDTNELAHELINKYKTIAGVLEAPVEELVKFKYITENNVVLLKLLIPIAREYYKDKSKNSDNAFKSIEDICNYLLNEYFGFTNEKFGVLCLGDKGNKLCFEILAEGDLTSVGVSTREIIQLALKTNATCVVICHNHPGGIALPSGADIALTEMVINALSHIGVKVLDHIIIANGDYVSLYQSKDYKHLF